MSDIVLGSANQLAQLVEPLSHREHDAVRDHRILDPSANGKVLTKDECAAAVLARFHTHQPDVVLQWEDLALCVIGVTQRRIPIHDVFDQRQSALKNQRTRCADGALAARKWLRRKRLRRNRDIRAAPCRVLGSVTGDWVSGTGRIIEDRALIAHAEHAFETKYGWQIHLFNFFSKLAGKYPKRAWLELTL